MRNIVPASLFVALTSAALAQVTTRIETAKLMTFSIPGATPGQPRGAVSSSILSVAKAVAVFGFEGGQVVALNGVSPQPLISLTHTPNASNIANWQEGRPPSVILKLEWVADETSFISFSASGSFQLHAYPSGQLLFTGNFPHAIEHVVANQDLNKALVSDYSGNLFEYSLYPTTLLQTLSTCSSGDSPYAFGYGPDGDSYWISYGSLARTNCNRTHEIRSLTTNQLIWSSNLWTEGASAYSRGVDELVFSSKAGDGGVVVNISTQISAHIDLDEEQIEQVSLGSGLYTVGRGNNYIGIRALDGSSLRKIEGSMEYRGVAISMNAIAVPRLVIDSAPPPAGNAPNTAPVLLPDSTVDIQSHYEVSIYSFSTATSQAPGAPYAEVPDTNPASSNGTNFERIGALIGHSGPATIKTNSTSDLLVSARSQSDELVFWSNASGGYIGTPVNTSLVPGGLGLDYDSYSVAPSGQVVACLSKSGKSLHLFNGLSAALTGTHTLFSAQYGTENVFARAVALTSDTTAIVCGSDKQLYRFDAANSGQLTLATAQQSNSLLPFPNLTASDSGDRVLATPSSCKPGIGPSDQLPKIISSSPSNSVSRIEISRFMLDNWQVFLPSAQSWIVASKGGVIQIDLTGAIQVLEDNTMNLRIPGLSTLTDRPSSIATRFGSDCVLLLVDNDTMWELDFSSGAYSGLTLVEQAVKTLLAGDPFVHPGYICASPTKVFVTNQSGNISILSRL